MASPFTIHQNKRFESFVDLLEKEGICKKYTVDSVFLRLEILDEEAFYDVFCVAFILYLTPENDAITVSNINNLIYKGGLLQLKLTELLNEKAAKVIEAFSLSEDIEHEPTFNILLSIYIAAQLEKFRVIYPNTYIVELGKNTHEIDIIFSVDGESKFHKIETTRGFDKIIDKTHGSSFNWHFKKAVFRKWALEKIYDIECPLLYLSVKSHLAGNLNQDDEEEPSLQKENTDLNFIWEINNKCPGIEEISLTKDYISGSYIEIREQLKDKILPQIDDWLEVTS